ncbi:MAG: hypothetical protein R6X31_06210 [Anaerolineae bacterium]
MKRSRPAVVTVVAIFQFIPAFLLPPEILVSAPPLLLLIPVALFVFMGWGLLTLKPWATTLSIFVQGFSVITRFLILWPQASPGETTNWSFVLTSAGSIALSTLVLYLIDRPSVKVAFQA